MKTMFRLFGHNYEALQIVKETEKQVVYINKTGKEFRENKYTDYQSWHNSEKECIERIISNIKVNISQHNNRINISNKIISELQKELFNFHKTLDELK